ncbi:hypothetical protein ACHAXT_005845 [Thalassiosira profunda]
MVSTHAWKAAVSSPPPATTTTAPGASLFSPGAPTPFATATPTSAAGMVGGTPSGSTVRPFVGGSDPRPSTGVDGAGVGGVGGGAPADFGSLLASSASLLAGMRRSPAGMASDSTPGAAGGAAMGTGMGGAAGGANSGVRLGDKSLLELGVASRDPQRSMGAGGPSTMGGATSTFGGPAASTTYEAEAAAHRLLAREGFGFDSARLGRTARELERRATVATPNTSGAGGYGPMEEEKKDGIEPTMGGMGSAGGGGEGHPLANLRGASLHDILAAHHDHCVRSAITKAREQTERRAKERSDVRLAADWETERREALGRGVPGSRFLLGGTSTGGIGDGGGVAPRVPLLEGGSAALALGATSSSLYERVVPSPQALPAEAGALIQSHLAAVDQFLTAPAGGDATALLAALSDGAKNVAATNAGPNPEAMAGYANALALVQSIANCNARLNVDSNSDGDLAAASGVLGACNFFAGQFAAHAKERVRDAELAGMHATSTANNNLSSTARDICAFASLSAGRDVVEGKGGVWVRLFCCLRCGDLSAAQSVLDQFGNAGGVGGSDDGARVDPAVASVVSQLAEMQGGRETVFETETMLRPSPALLQSRRHVADLYERAKTSSPSSAASEPYLPYRTACLALLGGSESISEATALEASGVVATVEDYLYGALWHAVHQAEDGASSSGNNMAGGNGGLHKVAAAVARLSALVQQWGPTYFEREEDVNDGLYASASEAVALAARGGAAGGATSDRGKAPPSGGWAYALPLMAAGQYASALAYVAEAGGGLGLLQAAHLGVAIDAAGLSLGDFGLEEHSAQNAMVLPMLVASYSASLQGTDAVAALKYLVLLSNKGRFAKEQVPRLLLDTRAFDVLAGTVGPDGMRSNGALDAHFSQSEASALLVDTANQAVRAGRPADAAELLVLAGRYGALFELMNRELASYLNASAPEDVAKRQFWFHAASQFHALHLSNGRNYVQAALDAEGGMHLGNTFQLLMNLVVFFDRCQANQWDGAWALMDTLALVPRTDAEMTSKVEAYRALDGCVRRVFHHVIVAAMECLCHLHRTLKHEGGAAAGGADRHGAVEQNLAQLRSRARLLVTFARLLNLPSLGDGDTYVRIGQLEKNMM